LRRLLAEELGIDPSRDLVELETAILTQDPSLEWSPNNGGSASEPLAVPAQRAVLPIAAGVTSCTLMLTDIEGSTQLWEQHPRDMADAIRRHQEIVANTVQANGGEVVKPRGEGDSTLSVFRLASDATAAAAEVMQALEREQWPSEVQLRVRIAVHTGEVELRDGDYYGATVNRAARLRALAAGGQILLSGTTMGLVIDGLPHSTTLIDLGLRPLRDLSRPEHIYELARGSTASAPVAIARVDLSELSMLDWAPTRSDSPFVGRADALKALQGHWDSAVVGRRQLVFIAGEPGSGKTRLAAEHARAVNEQGGLVLFGRWDEEPISPFQGFLEALGTFAERCPPSVLFEDVRPLAGDLEPLFPKLARYHDGVHAERPSTETGRYLLFEAIDAWLRRIAARCPVLLVLDDLQWADRPTLLLLRHLARSASSERVMIVGTYRDTDHPAAELASALADLRRSAGFARIDVSGFGADDVDELLETFSSGDLALDTNELVRELLTETSGNAFFVTEMVRDLTGSAYRRGGTSVPVQWRVPESIREMVVGRVGRLSVACADVLRVASVIGSEFGVTALRKIAGLDDAQFDSLLDEAEESRLVRPLPRSGEAYTFEHAVVRHVLHDSISAARRRRLHRRTAEVLEVERAADRARRVAELAYHFCEGADDDVSAKAVSYAREAGDDAAGQLAFESAADHYRRAIAVLDQFGGDALVRCELLLVAGDARNRAGQSQIGKDDFVAAADAARELGRTDLLVRAALGYGGELPASLEPDHRARQLLVEALDALGESDELTRACALGRLAQWIYFVTPPQVRLAYCEEAVRLARAHDDLHVLATVLTSRCRAMEGPEDLESQLRVADEIIALGNELADGEVVLQGLRCRLHRVFESGDFDAANAIVGRMREVAASLRSQEYLRLITMWDGLCAGTQGRFHEASRHMSETIAMMAGHPQMQRVLYFQALVWRALQQRLADRIDLVVAAATAEPGIVLWRALWAWFAAEAGQYEVASEQLDHIDFSALEPANRRFDFFTVFAAMTVAIGRVRDEARPQDSTNSCRRTPAETAPPGKRRFTARSTTIWASCAPRSATSRMQSGTSSPHSTGTSQWVPSRSLP
jgi:class 3 adenylate cyclase